MSLPHASYEVARITSPKRIRAKLISWSKYRSRSLQIGTIRSDKRDRNLELARDRTEKPVSTFPDHAPRQSLQLWRDLLARCRPKSGNGASHDDTEARKHSTHPQPA